MFLILKKKMLLRLSKIIHRDHFKNQQDELNFLNKLQILYLYCYY